MKLLMCLYDKKQQKIIRTIRAISVSQHPIFAKRKST
jgi:hypothetical protein